MKVIYSIILLLLCVYASASVVYKTIKEDGSVVYTDTPTDTSTPVKLSAVNNIVPTLNKPSLSVSPNNQTIKRKLVNYIVSINSPAPEAHIRNNAGQVSISVSVSPKGAGNFQLMMDGQVIKTQTNNLFELEGINRGIHTIKVNFLNKSGKILASSPEQTFYLHKASALIQAN